MQYLPATVICDYGKCIMLFVVFSIATEPVLRYLTKLIEWLRKQYIKFIKNPIKEFKGKAAD